MPSLNPRSGGLAGRPGIRRVLAVLGTAVIGLSATACDSSDSDSGGSDGLQSVTFGIAAESMASNFVQIPVAQELGYFEEEGIEIEPVFLGTSTPVLQAEATGRVQLGQATPDVVLQAIDNGQPLQMVYNWNVRPVAKFGLLPDSPIQRVADFAGRTIGVQDLSSGPTQLATASLRQAGLDPDNDVTFVAVGTGSSALDALQRGRVDALMLYDSLYAAIETSAEVELRYLAAEGIEDLFATTIVAPREFVEENPDIVAGFGRAWAKADVWAQTNPEAAIQIMWQLYPNSKAGQTDDEAMEISMAQYQTRLDSLYGGPAPEDHQWGYYPPEAVEHWIEFALEYELISEPLDADTIYTNQFVSEYNDFDAAAVRRDAEQYQPAEG